MSPWVGDLSRTSFSPNLSRWAICCRVMLAAASCPARLLRQDRVPRIVARARANPSICLIFCDENEEAAPAVAHRMTTQGYANVKVLSGGVRAVARRSPLLLDGSVPERMLEDHSPAKARTTGTAPGRATAGSTSSRRAMPGSRRAAPSPASPTRAARAPRPSPAIREAAPAVGGEPSMAGGAGPRGGALGSREPPRGAAFDREALVRRGVSDRSGAGAASLLGMSVHDRPSPRR